MKKYERLPLEQRKAEICSAATALFNEKGFAATTMENIVDRISLSKGGLYRIYPSTTAVLCDIILEGMHKRNDFYEQRIREELQKGKELTLPFFIEMIADSLFLYPEISAVYVEFLWEKQRRQELADLYKKICDITVKETVELINRYGAEGAASIDGILINKVTEMMNGAILSLHVLGLKENYIEEKKELCRIFTQILGI